MHRRNKPWPISDHYTDKCYVYYAVLRGDKAHPKGVIIFSVLDWGRRKAEIDSRASGVIATRRPTKMVLVGTTSRSMQDECYENIESAQVRWKDIRYALRKLKNRFK